jgi:hypothetical protein
MLALTFLHGKHLEGQVWWLMPVIPATQKVEIRRVRV